MRIRKLGLAGLILILLLTGCGKPAEETVSPAENDAPEEVQQETGEEEENGAGVETTSWRESVQKMFEDPYGSQSAFSLLQEPGTVQLARQFPVPFLREYTMKFTAALLKLISAVVSRCAAVASVSDTVVRCAAVASVSDTVVRCAAVSAVSDVVSHCAAITAVSDGLYGSRRRMAWRHGYQPEKG